MGTAIETRIGFYPTCVRNLPEQPDEDEEFRAEENRKYVNLCRRVERQQRTIIALRAQVKRLKVGVTIAGRLRTKYV